jgi:hypothetical protein
VFGVVVIAEALERTRGLAASTYGGAFWPAVAFVVVLVLVEVITWFTPRREGERAGGCLAALLTRPLAAVMLLLLPCTVLVRGDLGGTDVPDIITTTALLCVLGYGLFVLPIAFVSLALRSAGGSGAWASARASAAAWSPGLGRSSARCCRPASSVRQRTPRPTRTPNASARRSSAAPRSSPTTSTAGAWWRAR